MPVAENRAPWEGGQAAADRRLALGLGRRPRQGSRRAGPGGRSSPGLPAGGAGAFGPLGDPGALAPAGADHSLLYCRAAPRLCGGGHRGGPPRLPSGFPLRTDTSAALARSCRLPRLRARPHRVEGGRGGPDPGGRHPLLGFAGRLGPASAAGTGRAPGRGSYRLSELLQRLGRQRRQPDAPDLAAGRIPLSSGVSRARGGGRPARRPGHGPRHGGAAPDPRRQLLLRPGGPAPGAADRARDGATVPRIPRGGPISFPGAGGAAGGRAGRRLALPLPAPRDFNCSRAAHHPGPSFGTSAGGPLGDHPR